GEVAGAGDRGTLESLLVGGEVIDADNPSEPAAAHLGTGANGLAERRLLGGRVLEHLDHLDVAGIGERDDVVARAKPWMEASILEFRAQLSGEALGISSETGGANCKDQVVHMHAAIVPPLALQVTIGPVGHAWERRCDGERRPAPGPG